MNGHSCVVVFLCTQFFFVFLNTFVFGKWTVLALAENYVAAALAANGHTSYYWESNGKAEVDFVLQMKNGDIIPVEVKSGEHTKAKSLMVFNQRYNPPYSIRISGKIFGFANNIKSVPLYAVFLI